MSMYKAIVTDVNDPQKLGRVKVKCQQIVGSDQELPMWIAPYLPYRDKSGAGFFGVPSVDTSVDLVEIDDGASMGEYHEAFLDNAQYRYIPGEFSPASPASSIWQGNYPKRFGYSTPAGHAFIFDEQDKTVTLVHASGNGSIVIEQDGTMTLKGTIKVGEGASEALALGDALVTMLTQWRAQEMGHTHTAPGGATGTPIYPGAGPDDPTTSGLTSSKHKVES